VPVEQDVETVDISVNHTASVDEVKGFGKQAG
jgi:hypothetical protein